MRSSFSAGLGGILLLPWLAGPAWGADSGATTVRSDSGTTTPTPAPPDEDDGGCAIAGANEPGSGLAGAAGPLGTVLAAAALLRLRKGRGRARQAPP